MSGKSVVAAGLIIFRRFSDEIQYLLLQTSYGEKHWTPPKGHVDPGESERETAIRETEEEAGLNPTDYTIIDSFHKTLHYEVRGKPKRVEYWLSELKDPNVKVKLSEEHINYEWLNIHDVMTYISKYKDMQEVLSEAENHIKSNL
ncbi:hypothetical protein FSP39_010651 [Pinctada imbricata]|uniref:Bis(5'-nucleosyl)-tetraphosphatase [asymmetrical] n=1 Tax=Pinctada imbricata TaxID=66713 RepID=A0AA89C342_PINIB|nr:hypothetical protein FSP39_010651 [Pinctada imbricata]